STAAGDLAFAHNFRWRPAKLLENERCPCHGNRDRIRPAHRNERSSQFLQEIVCRVVMTGIFRRRSRAKISLPAEDSIPVLQAYRIEISEIQKVSGLLGVVTA